jgi:hypothetical protein
MQIKKRLKGKMKIEKGKMHENVNSEINVETTIEKDFKK